jgi:hypothetical protein
VATTLPTAVESFTFSLNNPSHQHAYPREDFKMALRARDAVAALNMVGRVVFADDCLRTRIAKLRHPVGFYWICTYSW